MGENTETESPSPAIQHYRYLTAVQFGLGFLLLFFATYTVMKIHGEGNGTFPYYAGSFMTSIGIIALSVVGVAIYDVAQRECEAEVTKRVKPLIFVHFFVTLVEIIICIIGFILTTIYGVCPSSRCSYTTNKTLNYGMAAFFMTMHLLCLCALVLGFVLFYFYQKHLMIHPRSQDRTFSSNVDI